MASHPNEDGDLLVREWDLVVSDEDSGERSTRPGLSGAEVIVALGELVILPILFGVDASRPGVDDARPITNLDAFRSHVVHVLVDDATEAFEIAPVADAEDRPSRVSIHVIRSLVPVTEVSS